MWQASRDPFSHVTGKFCHSFLFVFSDFIFNLLKFHAKLIALINPWSDFFRTLIFTMCNIFSFEASLSTKAKWNVAKERVRKMWRSDEQSCENVEKKSEKKSLFSLWCCSGKNTEKSFLLHFLSVTFSSCYTIRVVSVLELQGICFHLLMGKGNGNCPPREASSK